MPGGSAWYEIGPFRLDPEAGVLLHDGVPMPLGPRAVDVLAALVESAPRHVPKSRILDAAWPGMVVEEGNLAVQISAIRRALGRVPGGERWVETLARRGYRFVGPLRELHRPTTGAATPTNIGAELTSFIGRERELEDVRRLVAANRLVTLTGMGGIGKTRLALQAASDVRDRFPDGAWFVDLASLESGALLPATIAQVLQVREVPGKPLVRGICEQLRGRVLLVVLDNCEQLLEPCAALADTLLRSVPGITLLVTSRELLRIPGEQTYALPPLSLPEPSAQPDVIAGSEAVRLFVDRARRQVPDFELTAERTRVVARLCIDLDGIPLALELAAARMRSLSIDQIHARLDDRFRLLTQGPRTALPRQQTLKAALDWSYDLLDATGRSVLARCAVFVGGFTLEAAACVASDAGLDEAAAAEALSQLVARSLLVAETHGPQARYRFLETMRAYALEKLSASGELESLRRRHARHFQRFFEHAPSDWLHMPDAQWRAIYVPELLNLRAALDWSMGEAGDGAIAVSLAAHSCPLWTVLSMWEEGRERTQAALVHLGPGIPESHRARLWTSLGILLDGAPDKALVAFEQAVALYRALGDAPGWSDAMRRCARVLTLMGRIAEAGALLEEVFPVVSGLRIPKSVAFYHSDTAFLRMQAGDPSGAREHYETALRLFREAGAEYSAFATLASLPDVAWASGDLEAAARGFREVIATMRASPLSRKSSLGFALGNLAGVLTERGELEEALAAAREALPALAAAGNAWVFMDHFALRAGLGGRLEDAARLLGHVDATFASKAATPQPNEARARARLRKLLEEELPAEVLSARLREGAALDEAEAFGLALR
ncbi:MAG TPA: winged helix-turn-helix domain-containing protein [Usitatibacter sp.]|nr:winged helix-turn-helix domain-containing protein [Usitatibacter sp.]